MKNNITHTITTTLLTLIFCTIGYAQTSSSRGQAWRIYRGESSCVEFVSFPLSNPGKITVETTLQNKTLLTAVRTKDAYYMIDSDEGGFPARLLRYDTERGRLDTVRTYNLADPETVFIFLDMTYDADNDEAYVLAFDIAASTEAPDGTIESPQGLYKLDTRTGRTSLVGLQNDIYFICIAIANDGRMLGVTSEGRVWTIDKSNFTPLRELTDDNYEQPSSLQSAEYDPVSGNLYWAGFSETDMGFLGVFSLNKNPLTYKRVGLFNENSELVGLSIDSSPLPRTSASAPTDFVAKAGERGAKTAHLTWRMPTKDLDGGSLLGMFEARIYANGQLLATLPELQQGAEASWSGVCPEGMVEFSIRAKDFMREGRAAYADSIFIGADLPGCPEYLEAVREEDSNEVTLTWEEPLTGMHGGWYDAASMTYTVVRYPDEKVLAEGLRECTFIDKTITEPHAYFYRVYAQTGEGRGPAAESTTIIAGGMLSIPYFCDFSSDELVRFWTVLDGDDDGYSWGHAQNYQSAQYSYMRYFPDERLAPNGAADDWLISPPIRMKAGQHYRISYNLRTQGSLFPLTYDVTLGREATREAQSTVVGGAYQDTNGGSFSFVPKSHIFSTDEDGTWHIAFHVRNRVSMHVTDVKIEEVHAQDIALEGITFSELCSVGEAENFVFTVRNAGFEDISSYTLVLHEEDGTVLTQKSVETPLAVGEVRNDTLQWTCPAPCNMLVGGHAEILKDDDASNNYVEARSISFNNTAAWYDFKSGYTYTRTSPFTLEKTHSFAQSIYPSEWLEEIPRGRISAMRYYFKTDFDRSVTPFRVRVLMANTDLEGYEARDAQPIGEDFQEVFDGEVQPTGREGYITLTFNTPFDYDGSGIAITVFSNSPDATGEYINWICYYRGTDEIMHTIYQSGASEYDYKGDVSASPELPHISFYWTDLTGILQTEEVRSKMEDAVYDLQGRKLSNSQIPKGIYIQNGRKIMK